MIRLLVGSVDPLAAAGLRSMLTGSAGIEAIGQASGVLQTVALARSLEPDIVLFDGGAGGREVPDLVARLHAAGMEAAVVVLSGMRAGGAIGNALREGVRGYLPRDILAEELAAAVHAVAEGLVVLHPSLVELLALPRATSFEGDTQVSEEALTAREREVLQLLAQGLANKQIAQRLAISEHTVKFHVGEVMAKLGAASRTEAVTRAARRGLLVL
jgi:two-component system, NarL family, nitrate/nitrite response regulator NarL